MKKRKKIPRHISTPPPGGSTSPLSHSGSGGPGQPFWKEPLPQPPRQEDGDGEDAYRQQQCLPGDGDSSGQVAHHYETAGPAATNALESSLATRDVRRKLEEKRRKEEDRLRYLQQSWGAALSSASPLSFTNGSQFLRGPPPFFSHDSSGDQGIQDLIPKEFILSNIGITN